jgi:hypothetical protein
VQEWIFTTFANVCFLSVSSWAMYPFKRAKPGRYSILFCVLFTIGQWEWFGTGANWNNFVSMLTVQ